MLTVANVGSTQGTPPVPDQVGFFFGKIGQIYCWRRTDSRRPMWEILEKPLIVEWLLRTSMGLYELGPKG